MRNSLFTKIFLIFLITLVLAIGLTRIGFLVDERAGRRDSVVAEIAGATARDQTLVGPVLVIPYTRIVKTLKSSDKDADKMVEVEKRFSDRLYLLPAELDVQAGLNTEQVRRSLYHAVVFGASIAVKGRFAAEGDLLKPGANEQIIFGEPRLMVGITDPRGILRAPVLTWAGQRLDFLPGAGEDKMPNGIQARIGGLHLEGPWSAEFAFSLDLRGTQAFSLAPVGDTTRITVRGAWPHPSFYGQFLPETREVTATGFSATWSTTRLATNMLHQLSVALRGDRSLDTLLGVRFVDPADGYAQTDRAIKYGLLFIGLTFAAFFLFEVLKRLAIHPLQYGLTGAALVLFYLLLLSLSEHLDFGIAYAIATAGCVALLGYYLVYVLGSVARGVSFGALLTAVFGILYVLISLEDHALLAGSVTLFGCLALVMVLTRKVDWYQLGDAVSARRGKVQAVVESSSDARQ
ncbi:MAG: cell envelope integrity protein CreD [Candidatus Competibacter sp.]|nr:cell envelope integrity protein CreD [Candidatus Competibacter sp.]MDG4604563.1 cell envelope integrity protein CreD [Candidatus Contendobacter sp.]HRD48227.1 cell envelope integrity protein CreD [Candidatus Contendobacter sp.]